MTQEDRPATGVSGSVIIPAHNEASVIERCLETLAGEHRSATTSIIVACNGCSDATAALARSTGVPAQVIELAAPSKTAAINAAEGGGAPLPRIYLDADVELTSRAAGDLLAALQGGALAARPPLEYRTDGASWLVRSYFRARCRAPSLLSRLWGAGVYGLSAQGRERFGAYPDVVGEDLWVDEHFDSSEIVIVDTDPVVVRVPRTGRALLRNLRRTQRGRMEQLAGDHPRRTELQTTSARTSREVLHGARAGWPAAVDAAVYTSFAIFARLSAKLAGPNSTWERDETSRGPLGAGDRP